MVDALIKRRLARTTESAIKISYRKGKGKSVEDTRLDEITIGELNSALLGAQRLTRKGSMKATMKPKTKRI